MVVDDEADPLEDELELLELLETELDPALINALAPFAAAELLARTVIGIDSVVPF